MTKERKPRKLTVGQIRVLDDLENGAYFQITHPNEEHLNDVIELIGGKKHKPDTVARMFARLQREQKPVEKSAGLFEGCGQQFQLVR